MSKSIGFSNANFRDSPPPARFNFQSQNATTSLNPPSSLSTPNASGSSDQFKDVLGSPTIIEEEPHVHAPLLRLAIKSRAEQKPNLIPLEQFVTPHSNRTYRTKDGEVVGIPPYQSPPKDGVMEDLEEIEEVEEEEVFELSSFLEEYQEEFNEESYFALSVPYEEDDDDDDGMDIDNNTYHSTSNILPSDLQPPKASSSVLKTDVFSLGPHNPYAIPSASAKPSPTSKALHKLSHSTPTRPGSSHSSHLSKRSAHIATSSPPRKFSSTPSPNGSDRSKRSRSGSGSGSGSGGSGDLGDFSKVFDYLAREKEKSLAGTNRGESGSGSDRTNFGSGSGGSVSTLSTVGRKRSTRKKVRSKSVDAKGMMSDTDGDFKPFIKTQSLRRQVLNTPSNALRGKGTADSPIDLVSPLSKDTSSSQSRTSSRLENATNADWLIMDVGEQRNAVDNMYKPLEASSIVSPSKQSSSVKGPLIDLTNDTDMEVDVSMQMPPLQTNDLHIDDNMEADMDISMEDAPTRVLSTFDDTRPFSTTTHSTIPSSLGRPFSSSTILTPFSTQSLGVLQTPLTTPDISAVPISRPVQHLPSNKTTIENYALSLLLQGVDVYDVAKQLMSMGIRDLNRVKIDLSSLDDKAKQERNNQLPNEMRKKQEEQYGPISESSKPRNLQEEQRQSLNSVPQVEAILIPDSPTLEPSDLLIQRVPFEEVAFDGPIQSRVQSGARMGGEGNTPPFPRPLTTDSSDDDRNWNFPMSKKDKELFILKRLKQLFPQDFKKLKNSSRMFDVPKRVAKKEKDRDRQFQQGLIRLTRPKEMPIGPPDERAIKGLWMSRTKGHLSPSQERRVKELLWSGVKRDSDEIREMSDMVDEGEAGRSIFSDSSRGQYGTGKDGRKPLLDYSNLFSILERGRKVRAKYIVGSTPLPQSLEVALDWGYEVSLLQKLLTSTNVGVDDRPRRKRTRAPRLRRTGVEQAVDEVLRMKLLEALTVERPPNAKVTMVLVSGDGAASDFSDEGFMTPIRAALKRGWNVEIVAFGQFTSKLWFDKNVTKIGQGTLSVIEMANWAEALIS